MKTESIKTLDRREFMAGAAAAGVTMLAPGFLAAAPTGAKTFTILHTNDMHASFLGMGPSSDYSPLSLNDDTTRGGYARLAALIKLRAKTLGKRGPVGDFAAMAPPSGVPTTSARGQLMTRPPRRWR